MIDDIKTQALEIQLARVGPNCRWEDILPASMEMQELLQYTDFTVGKLKKTGEILVTFNMALGRLMTIASERPAADWASTPYKNFTEYQDVALEPIAKHGTRFTAMRIFKELNGIPIEELEKCPIGNLNEIARQSEKRNLSDSQREDLLKAAAIMTNSELKDMMEKKGVIPEGEARTKHLTVIGAEADVNYLISWLNRKDVVQACGVDHDLSKILMATAEFDSTGPSAVQASMLLREISTDDRLPDDIREKIAAWSGSSAQVVEEG